MFLLHLEVDLFFIALLFMDLHIGKKGLLLFQQLHDISKSVCGPWIVMGNFNNVANLN